SEAPVIDRPDEVDDRSNRTDDAGEVEILVVVDDAREVRTGPVELDAVLRLGRRAQVERGLREPVFAGGRELNRGGELVFDAKAGAEGLQRAIRVSLGGEAGAALESALEESGWGILVV